MPHEKKNWLDLKDSIVFLVIFILIAWLVFFVGKRRQVEQIRSEDLSFTSDSFVLPLATSTEDFELDISKLDLLGSTKISYAGGTEGRHRNIEIGVSKIDGTIIMPGQEFSFKKYLGTTTLEQGYSVERIFLNGEVTKGVGGGLCQVSSALFRSALSAGLPVSERYNHSFTVSYYDVGLDATYSDPGPDLKFINDTKNPIVIKGKTEDQNAIFEIYGVADGRVASTSDPEITNIVDILPTRYMYVEKLQEGQSKCINNPQIGYTAKIKYGVMYPDGKYKERDFVSRYRPLQRVCYIVGDEIKTFDISKTLNTKSD